MFNGTDFFEQTKNAGRQQASKMIYASGGYITSVDPGKYLAKVMLEPLGRETGWLPICSSYVGNGFGIWALPELNTEVLVVFEMGSIDCGRIVCANYNNTDRPVQASVGDVVLAHKSGSFFKFTANGDAEINIKGHLTIRDSSGTR